MRQRYPSRPLVTSRQRTPLVRIRSFLRVSLVVSLCSWVLVGTEFTLAQNHTSRRAQFRNVVRADPAQAQSPWHCDDISSWGGDHGVGNIRMVGLGQGIFSWTGGTCWPGGAYTSAFEFPIYSGANFGESNIWVGGIRRNDTLVSTGINWTTRFGFPEFHPALPNPLGCTTIRTSLQELTRGQCGSIYHTDSAVSYEDIVHRYNDTTLSYAQYADPIDGRRHSPLGISIMQSSFAWSTTLTEDFVIVEFAIQNVGEPGAASRDTLRDVWFGMSTDAYALNVNEPRRAWDDYVGLVRSDSSPQAPEVAQDFEIAWVADNDGDPSASSGFDANSTAGIVGWTLLGVSQPGTDVSFNWWTEYYDDDGGWGPVGIHSQIQYDRTSMGYPFGDKVKYQIMTNREIDYPQWESAIDHSSSHWLPPVASSALARDIADGTFATYLFSVGPLTLHPDSTVTVTLALVGGENFHTRPLNFSVFDPMYPGIYTAGLDYTDLLRNAQWARWVYDNPGRDTDGDGYAGKFIMRGRDTVYYAGDGIPDLSVGLPPVPPKLSYEIRAKRVIMRWNGVETETEPGLFSNGVNFEGYRVYMSRSGKAGEWSFLAQRDLLNYARHTWDGDRLRWEVKDRPFSLDTLKLMYEALTDSSYGYPFHPDSFPVPLLDLALLEVLFNPDHPEQLDSVYRYFTPYEANHAPDDRALVHASDAGMDIKAVIRKLYPEASPEDTLYREDATPFAPYYEYEYVLDGLSVAEPNFFSLTAFDHGDATIGLEPLESSVKNRAQELWPINSSEVVESERPKPGVYPNPYRLIDAYYDNNWENRKGLEPDRERARQVTFYNVPDTCVLSIWSLDGDLVKRMHHSYDPSSSEATVVRWDLITKNTQAVKTGIYIWSVESRFGADVGKLVIIK